MRPGRPLPQAPRFLTFKRLALPIIEIAFGCYMVSCIWISVVYLCGIWAEQPKSGIASLPFLLIFAGGYFYVGFASLHTLYQMNREAEEIEAEIAEAEPVSTLG